MICDLVHTKDVNDQYGFAYGDQYIRNAAQLLKEIFSNSPVFRVGGDEFLTMLRRTDYQNREELTGLLLASFRFGFSGIIESGYTEFRISTAVYDAETDTSVADVIRRAQLQISRDE